MDSEGTIKTVRETDKTMVKINCDKYENNNHFRKRNNSSHSNICIKDANTILLMVRDIDEISFMEIEIGILYLFHNYFQ